MAIDGRCAWRFGWAVAPVLCVCAWPGAAQEASPDAAKPAEAAPAPVSNATEESPGAADPAAGRFQSTTAPDWEIPPSAEETPPPPPTEVPDYFSSHRAVWDEPAPADDAAADTDAPPTAPDRDWAYYAVRGIIGLLVACGGVLVLGYLLRRFGGGSPLLAGPHLGQVLGRVHLSPKASLYFVQSGGRVLVIGVTQNSMARIAEFDAEAFEGAEEMPVQAPSTDTGGGSGFMAQLRAAKTPPASPRPQDDDMTALRGDIQRLQQYLQESSLESPD